MLTETEYAALLLLVQRAPMNHAEALTATAILEKLRPRPEAEKSDAQKP